MVTAVLWPLPASARQPAKPSVVKVEAGKPTEYAYVVSPKTVPRGTVTFVVLNEGKRSHDFKIAGKKTPILTPGESASLTVTLAKPKSYVYFCTIAGHAVAGMKGVLRVT
jgi:uncharacterized cupredoxin-like copper-binding protein